MGFEEGGNWCAVVVGDWAWHWPGGFCCGECPRWGVRWWGVRWWMMIVVVVVVVVVCGWIWVAAAAVVVEHGVVVDSCLALFEMGMEQGY